MEYSGQEQQERPMGVIAALALAFDRVAGHPHLIAPILLMDLFLWFGPRLKASALVGELAGLVALAPGVDAEIKDQLADLMIELGTRFNLFTALTSSPSGIPSLMAGRMPTLLFDIPGLSYARMPASNPLGLDMQLELTSPLLFLVAWLFLTLMGAVLGAYNHLWLARQTVPTEELSFRLVDTLRIIGLAVVVFLGFFLAGAGLLVLFPLAWLILPMLALILLLMAFGTVFWLGIYLTFAPHGIVRHGLGIFRSILESINVVRWNFFSTLRFLMLAFAISWVGGLIWNLPEESSWFSLLAVLGHAFVSATLLLASYVFYQSRHDWMRVLQDQAAERKQLLITSEVGNFGKEEEKDR
jgi:hypothetical protein